MTTGLKAQVEKLENLIGGRECDDLYTTYKGHQGDNLWHMDARCGQCGGTGRHHVFSAKTKTELIKKAIKVAKDWGQLDDSRAY